MEKFKWNLRRDILFFDLLLLFVLTMLAVVLLYAGSTGSLMLFVPIAGVVFIMILSYSIGLQPGLIAAIAITFVYGSYMIYESMVVHRITEVNFGYVSWFFFFPVASFLAGRLAEIVASYNRAAQSSKELEKLVTLDASTGFYNTQGFFKKLDEEFLRAKRYKNQFSVLLVRIGNFDDLHKIYGDVNIVKILQTVADIVSRDTRYADIKSIVDGNMLSVILTETDEEGARIVMEKMHKSLDRITTDISGVRKMLRISPSIGVSTIREEDTDAIEMYERAKEEFVYDKG